MPENFRINQFPTEVKRVVNALIKCFRVPWEIGASFTQLIIREICLSYSR
jgi:hypothetical protein